MKSKSRIGRIKIRKKAVKASNARLARIKAAKQAQAVSQEKPAKKIKSIWSKKDLKLFKALLIRQREKIVGEVEHITNDTLKKSQKDASGDLSGYTLHMADMSGDQYDREVSLGIASSEQGVIYDIDEALRRIADGAYGICFTCEKAITKKRLKVVPHAKCCISCQQKEELLNKKRT